MGAYIINVPDTVDTIIYVNIGDVYDGKTYIASQRVEDLTPYTEPDLEQVRKEAYEKGKMDAYVEDSKNITVLKKEAEEAYQRGLNDAWEAARTLWNTPNRKEIFGHTTFNTVLTTLTAQEAIEKIRQYEQEKEEQIQVGDEVIATSGKAVIVGINADKDKARYIYPDSTLGFDNICNLSKTGRHFPEIAEVLQKMKES